MVLLFFCEYLLDRGGAAVVGVEIFLTAMPSLAADDADANFILFRWLHRRSQYSTMVPFSHLYLLSLESDT